MTEKIKQIAEESMKPKKRGFLNRRKYFSPLTLGTLRTLVFPRLAVAVNGIHEFV